LNLLPSSVVSHYQAEVTELAQWTATTKHTAFDPGAVFRFSGNKSEPSPGDSCFIDGPGQADGAGKVISIDARQVLIDLKAGARLAFRRAQGAEKSGIKLDGSDWVFLSISPTERR